ncbi:MAG: hypothetical protein CMJ89_16980 [Planctomycetes bacterium]|jgi:protein-disulfide isomerase/uncharacterized membrane protein|nr:hypothetical protein [Planctomycetota bacterium]
MSRKSYPSYLLGALLLSAACLASLALALEHLGAAKLFGCGLESGCARALKSPFAYFLAWPTAFFGLSFFAGLLAAWLTMRARFPSSMLWLVRAGAVGSLLLAAEMFRGGYLCPYCFTVHATNLAFWVLIERRPSADSRALPVFACLFVLISASLWFVEGLAEQRRLADEEKELESLAQPQSSENLREDERFEGRYLQGPENAAIRLVVFTDYQCESCRKVDRELAHLLAVRSDLSLSTKHFPLSSDCNDKVRRLGVNTHPNACSAARAAEAGGLLGGDAGFQRMHDWLFKRGGAFSQGELKAALPSLGFEADTFLQAMQAPQTEAFVQKDIAEALALGLHGTPMIFINGREFRSWSRPGAVKTAVETVAAAELSADFRPPSAYEKFLTDWRIQAPHSLPPPGRDEQRVASSGVEVVLWGDYLEPNTRILDKRLRQALQGVNGASYSYRYFPLETTCNEKLSRTLHPGACLAARAAEAAYRAGGQEALEAMHAFLMESSGRPTRGEIEAKALGLGLGDRFRTYLDSVEVARALQRDIENARAMTVRSIPLLFIAGKLVPRWKLEDASVPEAILAEALSSR